MIKPASFALLTLLFTSLAIAGDPIVIDAPELGRIDFSKTDGGLPLAIGLKTTVILRPDKEHPETADGVGWTYHHHPDMACWRGRIYVGWSSCVQDEDTGVSREYIRTTTDGEHWSPIMLMFPQGLSTPMRMYFFHAPNGRMLALSGLRTSENTDEKLKGPMIVREIRDDHTLGPVFTLRAPDQPVANQPPRFSEATDAGFVQACNQLLDNHPFLEQGDYGNLLPAEQRIKWHDPSAWPADARRGRGPQDFGKAPCFFQRGDELVSVGKRGWVTTSIDQGKTWAQPVQPASLITGLGKVWGQRVTDGKYILVYDPDPMRRWPLAMLTSGDGITYRDPHVIHGPLPAQRYPGKNKQLGSSYIRGLSLWSNDGSRPGDPVWLVYSVNKEEIWVSRVTP